MKKSNILSAVFIFVLLVSIGTAIASEQIEITGENEKTINYGKSATFTLSIHNKMNQNLGVIALINGDNLEWVTLDKYFFQLPPFAGRILNIVVFPQDNGTHSYDLVIQSLGNNSIRGSMTLTVNARGPKKTTAIDNKKVVSLRKLDSYISEGFIIADASVEKNFDGELTLDYYLKGDDGRVIETFTDILTGNGTTDSSAKFSTQNLLAGDYLVEAIIREYVISRTESVVIPPEVNLKKTRKVTTGLFEDVITIQVENLGNAIEDEYVLTEKIPAAEYTTFDIDPFSQKVVGAEIINTWDFKNVRPRDRVIISYTIHKWFGWLRLLIALIIIIAAIAVVYIKLSSPRIVKRYVKKKNNEYLIILEVRGSYFSKIRSVLVKDRLSPLMRLDESKFEGIKPVVRKENTKTELLWRIGTMNRMDERIISYTVKGVVEAQIKLPPAMMRYKKAEEGDKIRVYSDEVMIE